MPEFKHRLHRLHHLWASHPKYFITCCTARRKRILANSEVHTILRQEWEQALKRYGWAVGSYVIMPDHAHFFCTDSNSKTTLSKFVGAWKEWSAKKIIKFLGIESPVWQKGFFDHLIRSDESYSEKRNYLRENPVRAGLVDEWSEWNFLGSVDYE